MRSLMDIMVGSCAGTRELLSEHVEGELTGLRRLRVRLHLAGCDACSSVARSLQATVDRLHDLQETFVPSSAPSVAPAVLERLQYTSPE